MNTVNHIGFIVASYAAAVAVVGVLIAWVSLDYRAQRLKLADLEMDVVRRAVTRSGETLDLTVREFELLEYLLIHQGRVVSREMLARDIWKEARHTPLDNVIDVHVARLRRKVDDRFDKKLVHTVRGVGFVVREGAE